MKHLLYSEDEETVRFQKLTQKKHSKFHDKRSHRALYEQPDIAVASKFTDDGLQTLADKGIISQIVLELRSGKEAVVYYATDRSNNPVAIKLYKDLRVRSFKKEGIYTTGRFIGSQRMEKAIAQRSDTGIDAQQMLWISEEFRQLSALAEAGVRVPKPLGMAGRAIAMEFIGDSDGTPAPRLADLRLSRPEAEDAFGQSAENLFRIVAAGRVHGDYSGYNILWHDSKAVVIDLPQVVEIFHNHNARELLLRDVHSLCASFERHGLRPDAEQLFRNALRYAPSRDW